MKITEEQFFTLTNPLFYIWGVGLFIGHFTIKFLQYIGIYDWYYIAFKLHKFKDQDKNILIELFSNRPRMFWLKAKAWDYAKTKIEKSFNSSSS